jgi:preprotein translocase subunit Sec61beta
MTNDRFDVGLSAHTQIVEAGGRTSDDFKINSKRELLIHNETTKHRASWCNTLASNVLVAGVIAPFTAALLSVHVTPLIIIYACFFLAGAVIIRGYGIELLKELRSDDDIRRAIEF